MRWSRYFLYTARTAPADAEDPAGQLLARAGALRRLPGGAPAYLPLGWRSLRKLEALVRRELEGAGAVELSLPPDRAAGDRIADLVRSEVRSYRQLPVHLFRIGPEVGDGSPAAGRGRGGRTAGGSSFHASAESLDGTSRAVEAAYRRVLAACALQVATVGAGGGALAFVASSAGGRDEVLRDPGSGRESLRRMAVCGPLEPAPPLAEGAARVAPTPDAHTVADVARCLAVDPRVVVKTLLYETDRGPVAALVRGDREIEEEKLRRAVGAARLALAGAEAVHRWTGAPVGFAGPVGLPDEVRLVADRSIEGLGGFVCGANRPDAHLVGVRLGRDLPRPELHDLLRVRAGDPAPSGAGVLEAWSGVELGWLGVAGVEGLAFTDQAGIERPVLAAGHGLDLDRLLAAVVASNHDAAGIVWPRALAPFEVLLVALDPGDEAVRAEAERLYAELGERGVDVLFDDRDGRPGAKFHDADLLGVPVRVVVGRRSLAEGKVELSRRGDGARVPVERPDAVGRALEVLRA